MAFTITEKFTDSATAKAWFLEHMSQLADAEDQVFMQAIHDLKANLPRMPRVTKKISSEERSGKDYNETKCDARVWLKGGFDAQCRCKKADNQFLCKKHQTEADKHDGLVKNGFFNQDRPTHHYNNTDDAKGIIAWHDVVIDKPVKKTKGPSGTRKPRCCGICGDPGHDKRSCPNKSSQQSSPMSVAELTAALDAAKAKEAAESADSAQLSEDEHDLSIEEQEAAGTGILDASQAIETVNAPTDVVDESLVDESPLDEDLDESSVSDEESPLLEAITFEGVPYTRNASNVVKDDDLDDVGEWNGTEIVFTPYGKKIHRMAKAAM